MSDQAPQEKLTLRKLSAVEFKPGSGPRSRVVRVKDPTGTFVSYVVDMTSKASGVVRLGGKPSRAVKLTGPASSVVKLASAATSIGRGPVSTAVYLSARRVKKPDADQSA